MGKSSGCRPATLGANESVTLSFKVDAETAQRFLATCPNLHTHGGMDMGVAGESSVWVEGPVDAITQALAAPFAVSASWACEKHIEPND